MGNPGAPIPSDALASLHIDGERRAQLIEILEFVTNIHHAIDPDRYRIDLADVEAFRTIDCAGTYTSKPSFDRMTNVEADDCWALVDWLGRHSALFTRDAHVH